MTQTAEQERRFSRQTRLAEIGPSGQARLAAARVRLGGPGFAGEIERRYVVAAGLQLAADDPTVDPDAIDRAADVRTLELRHEAAREVAAGALRALAAVRAALAEGAP
ncbi:MAG: hypothetical protein KF894_24520 [Labilithrix sp.]|nr:hypothetical protein [Labilithrix sp.]